MSYYFNRASCFINIILNGLKTNFNNIRADPFAADDDALK